MNIASGTLSLLFFGFVLWMFIDCVRNEEDKDSRMWWALALLIFPFSLFTGPIYFIRRYSMRKKVKLPYMKGQ